MSSITTTPAQEGHAGLPPVVDRAALRIVDRLAADTGHRAAVSWVHAGAVLHWAARHGLAPAVEWTADGVRTGLDQLAQAHPALEEFTDPDVVALWRHGISDEDAAAIAGLWAEHPLADPPGRAHGYLVGNAYQALSEESRKTRALAQTPRYVTELLLDLAFRPAADEHGLTGLRVADPSCGTGHILTEMLYAAAAWVPPGRAGQAVGGPGRVRLALEAVHGVDLDPYAALIARLRLVVAATGMCRANRATLPASWPIKVAAANALLDRDEPLLTRGTYHAIIANPPYVTPKTARERDAIRKAYPEVCSGSYALSLPFHQLMTELLVPGGRCAQLTANSFMKREFGTRFIEEYLPRFDLQWVIDTSGACIPGHGTPTVILAHRNQAPASDVVATVRGIQGEPSAPKDPSRGFVWMAIRDAVDRHLAHQRLAYALDRSPKLTPAPAVAAANAAAQTETQTEQLALFSDGLEGAA